MSDLTKNPILEVDPKSLDALFSANPKTLTDGEISRVVEELRRIRSKFAEDSLAGKRSTIAKAPKAKPSKEVLTTISTDDLEL